MKTLLAALVLLGSCRPVHAEPRERDPRCSMIEAALAIDDAEFQRFYRGGACSEAPTARDGGRLLVDVQGLKLRDTDSCPGQTFTLYHESRTRTRSRKVLQLVFVPVDDGNTWSFTGSYLDPPPHPVGGDGFDDIQYTCHVVDGRVSKQPRWRAWVQHGKQGRTP